MSPFRCWPAGSMVVPALLYLAINATTGSAAGWGIVVGTGRVRARCVVAEQGCGATGPDLPVDHGGDRRRDRVDRHRRGLHHANLALPWLIAAAAVFLAIRSCCCGADAGASPRGIWGRGGGIVAGGVGLTV